MRRVALSTLASAVLFTSAAAAQEPPPIIFSTYFRCSITGTARATEINQTVVGPIVQKHIDAGHLTGWGWRNHVQGGSWRALRSVIGTDLDVMMDVGGQINAEFREQHADDAAEFADICGSHDDYIWIGVANSPPNPDAANGPASISTYYICEAAREGRADQIFRELLAPIYQKHTDMGHLTNWGFFAHRSGGPYRRLETFSGADHKTLLDMQNAIYSEAGETDALAFNEFRQICGSHTDYMWITPSQ